MSDAQLASPQSIAKVTEFMPSSALFALPRSVENRAILRALANTGGAALAVRYVLAPGADMRVLNPTLAIDWLESLEELVAMPGDVGDQANATVAAILAAGPSLAELSENERARHLRVVRVRRVGSDDNELLTIAELVPISDSGRLFNSLPGELLRRLAAAVPKHRFMSFDCTTTTALQANCSCNRRLRRPPPPLSFGARRCSAPLSIAVSCSWSCCETKEWIARCSARSASANLWPA